jgi:hypothetical protein
MRLESQRFLLRCRDEIGEALEVIRLLRGPILASLAASLALYAPDQVHELYRIMAADRKVSEILLGVGSLAIMATCFWWVSFRILQRFGDRIEPSIWIANGLGRGLPVAIGALPILACALGVRESRPGSGSGIGALMQGDLSFISVGKLLSEEVSGDLRNGYYAGLILTAVLVAAFGIVQWHSHRTWGASSPDARKRLFSFFGWFGTIVSLAILIAVTSMVVAAPVIASQFLGALTLLALFFIVTTVMIGQITMWHEATRVPVFVLLGVAALSFSAMDWNDNHEIQAIANTKAYTAEELEAAQSRTAWQEFQAWYAARPMASKERLKSAYPVYVVAAQGGGIYAAFHTATFLARIHDLCPELSDHLFAISSVSGGSLGAATYAAVAKTIAAQAPAKPSASSASGACEPLEQRWADRRAPFKPGHRERAVTDMLSSDFLSPLAAGTLFPDYTQRFLPFALPAFDRARWLDRAFEASWANSGLASANPFEARVLDMWQPDGKSPMLLINTTQSDSGRRQLISPIAKASAINRDGEETDIIPFPLWHTKGQGEEICEGRDIRLSTAVGLSARFPWLAPAGSFTQRCGTDLNDESSTTTKKVRLVDGGYFDNSGVETALDLIKEIETHLKETDYKLGSETFPRIELHLIVLSTGNFPTRSGYGLGDALEPVRALLSTREARAKIAINRARREVSPLSPDTVRVHQVGFRNPLYTTPLGWRLSRHSREIIAMQSGRFDQCSGELGYEAGKNTPQSDCIHLMIFDQLNDTVSPYSRLTEALDLPEVAYSFSPEGNAASQSTLQCIASSLITRGLGSAISTLALVLTQGGQTAVMSGMAAATSKSGMIEKGDRLAFILSYAAAEFDNGILPVREGGCLSVACAMRRARESANGPQEPHPNGNVYFARGLMGLRGADNYRRMSELIGVDLFAKPEAIHHPLIGMKALIAWMRDRQFAGDRTLDAFTSDSGFDVDRAYDAYLSHTGAGEGVRKLFMDRYEVLRPCTTPKPE